MAKSRRGLARQRRERRRHAGRTRVGSLVSRAYLGHLAGLIFLADRIVEGAKIGGQALIGGLDVGVSRNFFGKQVHSFEAYIKAPPTESTNSERRAKSTLGFS